MTTIDEARLRSLAEKARPGKRFWKFNIKTHACYLYCHIGRGGWDAVMDFVRFGMRGAAPRFQTKGIMFRPDDMPEIKPDHNGDVTISHPDADFIAACDPTTIIGLLDELAKLRKERDHAMKAKQSFQPMDCGHDGYWRTAYGNCMACRARAAEDELTQLRAVAKASERHLLAMRNNYGNPAEVHAAIAALKEALSHIKTESLI